jgi:hypothetical protein
VAWVDNLAASLYNEIRDRVVDYVAWAVAELTGCEEPCRIALQIAAESGLAAMGLPPSLPDFDALVDQGIDYLAAEIATQIGVPPEVVETAYDVARRMVDRAKATRGLPHAPWLIQDSGFRPTVLQFDVARAVSIRAPAAILGVYWAGPPWRVAGGALPVPAVGAPPPPKPGGLQPDFTGLPPAEPLCEVGGQPFYGHAQRVQVWFEQRWTERFATATCVELWAIGYHQSVPPLPVEYYARLRLRNGPGEFADPFEVQCTP